MGRQWSYDQWEEERRRRLGVLIRATTPSRWDATGFRPSVGQEAYRELFRGRCLEPVEVATSTMWVAASVNLADEDCNYKVSPSWTLPDGLTMSRIPRGELKADAAYCVTSDALPPLSALGEESVVQEGAIGSFRYDPEARSDRTEIWISWVPMVQRYDNTQLVKSVLVPMDRNVYASLLTLVPSNWPVPK